MREKINQLSEILQSFEISNLQDLEKFRIEYLSKKGIISELVNEFRNVDTSIKKELGKPLNELKVKFENYWKQKKAELDSTSSKNIQFDDSLPISSAQLGSFHPLKIVEDQICEIFHTMGFDLSTGPEIEDDWHNFSALNFEPEHPARDMQDTFFIQQNVLRTHTSSVQIRQMQNSKPPLRLIMPGRVYRNEAVSSRSNCFFHQIEGLYVDKGVSFADLKYTLFSFVKQLFGEDTKIRFRSSYFPFTEPSAEMDIWAGIDTEEYRRLTKGTGWLEIMGCGMVHPNVLKNCNIDTTIYSGFAFGMGIDRMTMLKYGISDIRDLFTNDYRYLKQFRSI